MSSRPVRAALALLIVTGAAACAPDPRRAAASSPNVVVVVLDALRPDRLGCYGNQRGLTPFLDEWADRSYVFHRAHTAASYTIASVASLLTSRLLWEHGVEWFNSVLPAEALTLPEVLHERGYATGAFTASLFFKGFDQGFDLARVVPAGPKMPPRAHDLGAAARSFVRDRDHRAPFFLYLHLVESHVPYDLPGPDHQPPYRRGQPPDADRAMALYLAGSERPLAADDLAEVEDAYDGAVVVMDERLRALFTELHDVLDRAIVVIMADHGEDFGEHGNVGHGKTLYETSLRVPLLVRLPGQSRRVDVEEVVSLIDVAPTVLALLGAKAPSSFEGRALLADAPGWWPSGLWRSGGPGWREAQDEAYSQFNVPSRLPLPPWHRAAVVRGSHKLLIGADGARAYYDLDADPGETDPGALAAADRGRLERLLAALPHTADLSAGTGKTELDERARERLKALGYVE